MELTEISDRIDIRINTFEVPIEVDEYEKSLYLTRAQKSIYSSMCDEFELTGILSNFVQPFIKDFVTAYPIVTSVKQSLISNTTSIVVPSDYYKVIFESAYLKSTLPKYSNKEVKVIKTRIAEVPYKIDNPFRKPNDKEILRVVATNEDTNDLFEFILPESTELLMYSCKYLKQIKPIILEALPDGLTIENEVGPLNTVFIDEVTEKIIDLAVMSILQDKTALIQKNV